MHILQIPILRFPEIRGGVDKMVLTLVEELQKNNIKVSVLLPGDWKDKYLTKQSLGEIDIYKIRLRMPYDRRRPLLGFIAWLIEFPQTLYRLKKIIDNVGIDIIHAHMALEYQFYFRMLRWFGGPPYLITLHRGDVIDFERLWPSRLNRFLVRSAINGASRVNAVSEWLARRGEEKFPEVGCITHIYNGLNLHELDKVYKQDLDRMLPERFFVLVGSFDPYKGHDIAIRAWGKLRYSLPDIHLVIIGEGDLQSEYERLITSINCEDTIHLTGQLAHGETIRVMSRSLGMVIPSRNEGLGYILLEAGTVQIPVICSGIAPFTEVVCDAKEGLLVSPENPEEIADAVIRLVNDPGLRKRLGEALFNRVKVDFSAEKMTKDYLQLYREILAEDKHSNTGST